MPRRAEVGSAPSTRPDVPKLPYRSLKPYQARHLLAVDQPIPVPVLEKFVLARFRAPRWVVPPAGYSSPQVAASRIAPSHSSATLTLTRHSTLSGPYRDSDGWSQRVVYDVVCPRERWDDPPFTGGGDKDGLARAFPAGLPNREEGRVVRWLISAAQRFGGSVKVDVGNAGLPVNYVEVILSPAPVRNVDRAVFSQADLAPEDALALVQDVLPQAELATAGGDYLGPDVALRRGELPGGVRLDGFDEFDLADLHEAADEFDLAVLRAAAEGGGEPDAPAGYAILADLGLDGQLAVEVKPTMVLPEAVGTRGGEPQNGWLAYRVLWVPADLIEANWEFPNAMFLATADRVQTTAHSIAEALASATGGVLLDQSDLPFDAATDAAEGAMTPVAVGSAPMTMSRTRGTMCEIPFDV